MFRHLKRWNIFALLFGITLSLTGCDVVQSLLGQTAPSSNSVTMLIYDAPISLTIKTGTLLPGTTIAYNGKTASGAARVLLVGLEAPKKTGDTLDWQGSPVPNVQIKLTTRVLTFDDQSLTVAGTAHIELSNITIQPSGTQGQVLIEFSAPVSYTLAKSQTIPGSNVSYLGMTAEGAQFGGVQGYAFRKQLDSLEYNGRVLPKVLLRLDLRVISFSNEGAVLGGTANIKLETP